MTPVFPFQLDFSYKTDEKTIGLNGINPLTIIKSDVNKCNCTFG